MTDDGQVAPPNFEETCVKPSELREQLEGKTIAWLYLSGFTPDGLKFIDVGGPDTWGAIAFEFVGGAKMSVFAVPVEPGEYPPFRTIMLWRWFESPLWGTKRDIQRWRGMQAGAEPLISPIQREVHGAVVHGVIEHKTPNRMGGQDFTMELHGGFKLNLRSRRRAQKIDPDHGACGAFEVGLVRGSKIISPGPVTSPSGGPLVLG